MSDIQPTPIPPQVPTLPGFEFLPRPSVGRIVRYVTAHGEVRPAVIVRVWDSRYTNASHPGMSNMSVLLDGPNDESRGHHHDQPEPHIRWVGSVAYDFDHRPNTWHWPAVEPSRG